MKASRRALVVISSMVLVAGSDFHDIKRYKEFEVSPPNEWLIRYQPERAAA